MSSRLRLLALTTAVFLITVAGAHAQAPSIGYFEAIEWDVAPAVGESYYLRHSLMYEIGKPWRTTNYWVGVPVPINSKVTLVSLGSKDMQIRIEKTSQVLKVDNVEKFSQRDMGAIAKAMLSRTPMPIERFGEATARNIREGTLRLGMTKEQVVMTRGHPPGHKTPSLEIDTWHYWNNRFVTHTLVFRDGVLAEGRGLR